MPLQSFRSDEEKATGITEHSSIENIRWTISFVDFSIRINTHIGIAAGLKVQGSYDPWVRFYAGLASEKWASDVLEQNKPALILASVNSSATDNEFDLVTDFNIGFGPTIDDIICASFP